jgi:hypothetical protein
MTVAAPLFAGQSRTKLIESWCRGNILLRCAARGGAARTCIIEFPLLSLLL